MPAVLAAAAVLLLVPRGGGPVALDGPPAPRLARLADLTPARGLPRNPQRLLPILATKGSIGLTPQELEPIGGGVRPAPPVRIRIAAAHVNTTVQPVKASRKGLDVPPVGKAGWFDAGPRPGEVGRAVVIGHLDTGTGPGVFARVPTVPDGTLITVTDQRGDVHRFNVVGSTQVEKVRFPAKDVYGASDHPVLVLITCGGPYLQGNGYRDNVLVYARAA